MAGPPEVFDPYLHWLGIDPSAGPVHHYALLGLTLFEADPARIAAAADHRMTLIRQYQTGPRGAFTHKLLNELARAKICLLNPVSKPAYDQALHQLLYPPPAGPSATAAPPKPKRKLEDIMPPGWDPAALTVQPAISLPPRRVPHYESPAYSPEVGVDSPPGNKLKKQPTIALIAGLGAILVVIGVLSVLLIGRLLPRTEVPGDFEVRMPPQPQQPTELRPPPVEQAVVVLQEGSGELNLTPATAMVEGQVVREVVGTSEVLSRWSTAEDIAEWQFKLVKPGFFQLEMQYVAHPSIGGKQVEIAWDKEKKLFSLRAPDSAEAVVRDSHIILIKRGGEHTLTFRPTGAWREGALQLISVRLVPAIGP